MDFIDYREKLEIGFCDEGKFKYFKVKILNFLNSLYDDLDFDEYCCFCNLTGLYVDWNLQYLHSGNKKLEHCLSLIKRKDTLNEFLAYYMALTNSISLERKETPLTREFFCDAICCMLDESHIPVDLKKYKNEYFIFPKGAKELDDALVSEPLEWLKDYPNSHKAFVKALKAYSDASDDNASDIADLFRKSLETFFQEFFDKTQSLENLKKIYGEYLREHSVPGEISNNFETLLQSYTNYINNYAKHHDKASENVLEYIMYQTGNIIRLLIKLKEDDSNSD